MFTGIIEQVGTVVDLDKRSGNLIIGVKSALGSSLKIDESVSHNGVCLTVVRTEEDLHWVEAVEETLSKTNLTDLKTGSAVNLERALQFNGRLDGHLVQGHIDTTGTCVKITPKEGSTLFTFEYPAGFEALMIEKGAIAVNGVSLTSFDLAENRFSVAVIPFTKEHTTFQYLSQGGRVNLEFDLFGKYVLRFRELEQKKVIRAS